MKILITDKVIDYLLDLLKEHGYKYDYRPDITYEELSSIVKNYNILIIRGRTRIDKDLINKASNLNVIIRFGVGLNNIDLEYAKQKGIKVFNTPTAFTEAVAELTLALMLNSLRKLGYAHYTMIEGSWEKKKIYGHELMNKNIAIIGFGRIGRRLAELIKPFNVKISVYDVIKFSSELLDKYNAKQLESLADAVSNADIITIHVPLTDETRGMFNMNIFEKMKKKPFIINTSRGEIIVYEDLLKALENGLIRGFALDVYPHEPFKDERLSSKENVFLTPHIGAQTYEANIRASKEVIKILESLR